MKVVAIINPISGAGADLRAYERRRSLLCEALAARRLDPQIHITQHVGHARALAAGAADEGADLVLVWGGDGTFNEAAGGVLGTETAVGLIPSGSGNGLASSLGTPFDPPAAIATALDGNVRTIDAGMLDGRPFFNIAGIGADARIAALFNLRAKGTRGRWPYVLLGLREACRYAAEEYHVELDGVARDVRALIIAFANGAEYGNGIRLSAAARLDDGLLDATIVEDRSILARFWHARHLAAGSAECAPRVVVRQVRRGVICSSRPLEYHLDGETGTADRRVEVTLLPSALRVKG